MSRFLRSVIQPGGKLGAAGAAMVVEATGTNRLRFALARYGSHGSIGSSFGAVGTVVTGFLNVSDDEAFAVALQPDGKLLAAGGSRRWLL